MNAPGNSAERLISSRLPLHLCPSRAVCIRSGKNAGGAILNLEPFK